MKERKQHKKDNQPDITVSAIGDISFQGRLSDKPDVSVFSDVCEIINATDLGVANLENPLTAMVQKVPGKCTLRGNPGWARVMKEAGFNLVSLANNHIMDYGPEGLFDTMRCLDSAGIRHVGAGKNREEAQAPLIVSIRNWKIAFLARSSVIVSSPSYAGPSLPGVAFLDTGELIYNVRRCTGAADLVVVLLHWGLEEYSYPAPAQKFLARKLVDAGADAIIGHHPHVTQGLQRLDRAVVAYSLGNFFFDEFAWKPGSDDREMKFILSKSNRKGMILQLSWEGEKSLESSQVFTRIDSDGHVARDNDLEREKEFATLSKAIDRPLYPYWWRLHAMGREWDLRLKHTLSFSRIRKNILKLRPRHLAELVRSIRRSADITSEKSTNPYD